MADDRQGMLCLPAELRSHIYSYLFTPFPEDLRGLCEITSEDAGGALNHLRRSSLYLAPLLVCRTFYTEARNLAFSKAYHICSPVKAGTKADDAAREILRRSSRLTQARKELVRSLELPVSFAERYHHRADPPKDTRVFIDHWTAGFVNLEQLVLHHWTHRVFEEFFLLTLVERNVKLHGKLRSLVVVPIDQPDDEYARTPVREIDLLIRAYQGIKSNSCALNIQTAARPQPFIMFPSEWVDQHRFVIRTWSRDRVHDLVVTVCGKIKVNPNIHTLMHRWDVPRSAGCRWPGCDCENSPEWQAETRPAFEYQGFRGMFHRMAGRFPTQAERQDVIEEYVDRAWHR